MVGQIGYSNGEGLKKALVGFGYVSEEEKKNGITRVPAMFGECKVAVVPVQRQFHIVRASDVKQQDHNRHRVSNPSSITSVIAPVDPITSNTTTSNTAPSKTTSKATTSKATTTSKTVAPNRSRTRSRSPGHGGKDKKKTNNRRRH